MPVESSAELFAAAQSGAATSASARLDGVSVGGGSDGNFTAALGIPTLDGLGVVGGGAHADHEWVDVASLPDAPPSSPRCSPRSPDRRPFSPDSVRCDACRHGIPRKHSVTRRQVGVGWIGSSSDWPPRPSVPAAR